MRLLVPILAALLCSGCFVFEEIQAGREIMEAHSPDREEEEVAEEEAGGGQPKSARERLSEYYAKQRAQAKESPKSLSPSDDVGRCRIGGTTTFTRRSDCELRGGTFN